MRFRVSRSAPSTNSVVAQKRNVKDGANLGSVKYVGSIAQVSQGPSHLFRQSFG